MKIYFGYKIIEEKKENTLLSMILHCSCFNYQPPHDYISSIVVFIPSTIERAKRSREKLDEGWVIPSYIPDNYRAIILPQNYYMTKDLNLSQFEEDRIREYVLENHISFEFWPEVGCTKETNNSFLCFAYKFKNHNYNSLLDGYEVSLVAYFPSFFGLKQKTIDNKWKIVGEPREDYIPVYVGDQGCILTPRHTLTRSTMKKIEQILYNALSNIVEIKCENLGWFKKRYTIIYNNKEIIKEQYGRLDKHEILEEIIKTDFPEYYSGLLM